MSFVEKLSRGIMDGQIKYWQHILSCEECFKKHMEIIVHGTANPAIIDAMNEVANEMGLKL